ncbi:MAG: leucyl/phenylalanyl-tRNA--protein transferase [Pseudomonadota bacterium]
MIPPVASERPHLTAELLLHAYAGGVFPMAEGRDVPDIFWVDPKRRGIFPMDGFHMSRSLMRRMKSMSYQVRINTDFHGVVAACADREETWINDTIFDLYAQLHDRGFAHSQEIWDDDELIGGVYGVTLGGAFFGESMFSRRTDASKIALAYLMSRLRFGGFALFDAQFLTPHLASLGAVEISRASYRSRLAKALRIKADFLAQPLSAAPSGIIQRNTHTS